MSGSTGSLVLGVVGAAVGSMFFGMTSLGWAVGSSLGNVFFAEKLPDINQQAPRLSDLKIQTSTYGTIIPDLYGTYRISGNIIYSSGIRETQHQEEQESGNKGGGGQKITQTTFTYSVDCTAIALCKGKTKAVRRIWADGVLVYDISTTNNSIVDDLGADFTFYDGSETQMPDSTIESILGVGETPAYRGISYIVLKDLDLSKYNNRMPNFTFEVIRTDVNISQINGNYYSYKSEIIDNVSIEPKNNNLIYNKYNNYIYSYGYLSTYSSGNYIYIYKINPDDMSVVNKIYIKTYNFLQSQLFYAGPTVFLNNNGDLVVERNSDIDSTAKSFFVTYDKDTFSVKGVFDYQSVKNYFNYYNSNYNFNPSTRKIINIPLYSSNIFLSQPNLNDGGILNVVEFLDDGSLYSIYQDYTRPNNYINNEFYDINYKDYKIYFITHQGSGSVGYNSDNNNTEVLKIAYFDVNTRMFTFTNNIVSELSNNNSYVYDMYIDSQNEMMYLLMKDDRGVSTTTKVVKYDINNNLVISRIDLGYFCRKFNINKKTKKFFGVDVNNKEIVYYSLKNGTVSRSSYFYNVGDNPLNNNAINSCSSTYHEEFDKYFINATTNDITNPDKFLFAIYNHIGERLNSGNMNLKDVVDDLVSKSGIDMNDINTSELSTKYVNGYVVGNKATIRSCLEQLSLAYNFYAVESDFKVKFKFNGSDSIKQISKDELGASFYSKENNFDNLLSISRTQEIELPKSLNVIYSDIEKDYQENTQESIRHIDTTENTASFTMPLALYKDEAKEITERLLYNNWIKRDHFEFSLYPKYLMLEPGDVIDINDTETLNTYKLVINEVDNDRGILKIKATTEDKTVYNQDVGGASSSNNSQEIKYISGTKTIFLDIPILRNEDNDAGNYITVLKDNLTGSWNGSSLFSSSEEFGNYSNEISFYKNCTFGVSLTNLGTFTDSNIFDCFNEFNVKLLTGTLESRSEEDVLNGYNLAKIGNEIIQFKNAELIDTDTYKISGLLRGRFGTVDSINNHVENEEFILLNTQTLKRINKDFNNTNLKKYYKNVSFGKSLSSTYPINFTNTSIGQKCYKVFNVVSNRDNNGTLNIKWDRSDRGVNRINDYVDIIKLDEELYEIEILDNSDNKLRLITTNTNECFYNYTDQILDFGSIKSSIKVNIYKINKYGRGYVNNITI